MCTFSKIKSEKLLKHHFSIQLHRWVKRMNKVYLLTDTTEYWNKVFKPILTFYFLQNVGCGQQKSALRTGLRTSTTQSAPATHYAFLDSPLIVRQASFSICSSEPPERWVCSWQNWEPAGRLFTFAMIKFSLFTRSMLSLSLIYYK